MYSFLLSILALVLGYIFYGRFVERVFSPDFSRPTPATVRNDGIDYIPMPAWKVYMIQFQSFSQELMMLMGNLMKFKLRVPSIFKKTIYAMTEKTVSDIFMKNDYKDPSVIKSVLNVRKLNARLNFSQKWVTDFTYQVMMLAKKEPRPKDEDVKNK